MLMPDWVFTDRRVNNPSEQIASDTPSLLLFDLCKLIVWNKNQCTSSDSRWFNSLCEEEKRRAREGPVSCQHSQEIMVREAVPHTQSSTDLLCSPLGFSHAVSINNCIASLASEWLYNQTAICSSAGTDPPHCDSNWTERREEERQIAWWHLRNEI